MVPDMLHEFMAARRRSILERCASKIAESSAEAYDRQEELTSDLPAFLDELIGAFRREAGLPAHTPLPQASTSAVAHGRQRFELGFDLSSVVHDYGALC